MLKNLISFCILYSAGINNKIKSKLKIPKSRNAIIKSNLKPNLNYGCQCTIASFILSIYVINKTEFILDTSRSIVILFVKKGLTS